jgi:hypothetical protein
VGSMDALREVEVRSELGKEECWSVVLRKKNVLLLLTHTAVPPRVKQVCWGVLGAGWGVGCRGF